MTAIVDWIGARAPGFKLLTPEEVEAISDFSLLWTLFEARILNSEANARTICKTVPTWSDNDALALSLDAELSYLRQRYFSAGVLTPRFAGLNLNHRDRADLVRAVIRGDDTEPRDRVAAMLIIVLRYRNNLFHGLKWHYQLEGQLTNFAVANAIMMKVLERHDAGA